MPDETGAPLDAAALADAFRAIARSFGTAAAPEPGLAETVAQAVRLVPGATWVSVTVAEGAGRRTAAASAAAALATDRAQYLAAEGPCLAAVAGAGVVRSDDLAADPRWPALAARLAASPVRSALSVPVPGPAGPEPYCSLNLYGGVVQAFADEDLLVATLLAAHVGAVAGLAAAAAEARAQIHHLTLALDARDVIGQAKGILMEREGLTAAQAFDVLRSVSQRTNRKLRDVADDLAFTGRLRPDPDPPKPVGQV
jgi:GAF domain-containing protein